MFSSQHRLLLRQYFENPNPCLLQHLSALSGDEEEEVLFEDIKVPLFLKNHHHFVRNTTTNSCGGIIWFDNLHDDEIIIWNPTTNELRTLPPAHESEQKVFMKCSGLGYDSISGDYKFIRIIRAPRFEIDRMVIEGYTTRAVLYSFNRNSWKEIPNLTIPIMRSWDSAYVNGSYYWFASFDNYDMILSFDFANETFSTLPFPGSHDYYYWRVANFDGSLGVLRFPLVIDQTTTLSIELWVLNLESCSWTRVFDISLDGVRNPIGFGENGRLLFCNAMYGIDQLLVYDRITQELKEHDNYDSRNRMEIISYVETTNPLPQAKHTAT